MIFANFHYMPKILSVKYALSILKSEGVMVSLEAELVKLLGKVRPSANLAQTIRRSCPALL